MRKLLIVSYGDVAKLKKRGHPISLGFSTQSFYFTSWHLLSEITFCLDPSFSLYRPTIPDFRGTLARYRFVFWDRFCVVVSVRYGPNKAESEDYGHVNFRPFQ